MSEYQVGDLVLVIGAELSEHNGGYKNGDIIKISEITQGRPIIYTGYREGESEQCNFYGYEVILYDAQNSFSAWAQDIAKDNVSSPSHYTQGGVEVIDIIAQTVSGYIDPFTAHCVGTATKYLNRAPYKHATPLEDLRKAAKYIEFAIANEEKKQA